MKLLARLY